MKNITRLVCFLFFVLISQSCVNAIELKKCGAEWINIHKNNPNLIGIHVQQLPDDIKDREDYVGKHPVMIIYLFKGNRAHTVTYTPTGQIQNGVWWDIPTDHWARKSLVKDLKTDVECAYWK